MACRLKALYKQMWPDDSGTRKEEALANAFLRALVDHRQAKDVAKFRHKTLNDCVDLATKAVQWDAKESMVQQGNNPKQIYHIVDSCRYFEEKSKTSGTINGQATINTVQVPGTQPLTAGIDQARQVMTMGYRTCSR